MNAFYVKKFMDKEAPYPRKPIKENDLFLIGEFKKRMLIVIT